MKYLFRFIGFFSAWVTIIAVLAGSLIFKYLLYPLWHFRPKAWPDGAGWIRCIVTEWPAETWQKLQGTWVDPDEVVMPERFRILIKDSIDNQP